MRETVNLRDGKAVPASHADRGWRPFHGRGVHVPSRAVNPSVWEPVKRSASSPLIHSPSYVTATLSLSPSMRPGL